MTSQQTPKVSREKVRALKRELGPTLNTPDGCLRVLKYALTPDIDYPNPVIVAVREKFYGLMRRRNGNTHFNHLACMTRYLRLIEDIKNHSQRAGEDYLGEYSWKSSERPGSARALENWGIDNEF